MANYKTAAKFFADDKFSLYKAMALERGGEFCMRNGDKYSGQKLLREAYNQFAEFGALSKLPVLQSMARRKQHTAGSGEYILYESGH